MPAASWASGLKAEGLGWSQAFPLGSPWGCCWLHGLLSAHIPQPNKGCSFLLVNHQLPEECLGTGVLALRLCSGAGQLLLGVWLTGEPSTYLPVNPVQHQW